MSVQSIKDDKTKWKMKDSAYVSDSHVDSKHFSNRNHNERIINSDQNHRVTGTNPESSSSFLLSSHDKNSISRNNCFVKSNTTGDRKNVDSSNMLRNVKVNTVYNEKELKNISSLGSLGILTSKNMATVKNDKCVKNINDLKKVIPKVKVVESEMNNSNQVNKSYNFLDVDSNNDNISHAENNKIQLNNYCRTCAGLKIPLVDIFGERGIQMRLNQQMKHLEHIDENDSLPTQICMDCICDLKMSYKFFMQIKKAEVKLRSIFMSLNSVNTRQKEMKPDKSATKMYHKLDEIIEHPSIENKSEFSQLIISSSVKPPDSSYEYSMSDSVEPKTKKQCSEYSINKEFISDDSTLSVGKCDDLQFDVGTDSSSNISQGNADVTNEKVIFSEKVEPCERREEKYEISTSESNYQYDSELDNYSKVEAKSINQLNLDVHEPESNLFIKENLKETNIRKTKISLDAVDNIESLVKESKLDKLDTMVGKKLDDQGIMYVTVKGSKPSEMLLVKVKKMDKADDKKGGNCFNKNNTEARIAEKFCRTLSYKDIYNNRTKEIENRGAIIEEQIEEYKKKREKLLGVVNCSNSTFDTDDSINSINIKNSAGENNSFMKIQRLTQIEYISENKNSNLIDITKNKSSHFRYVDPNNKQNNELTEKISKYSMSMATTQQKSEKNNFSKGLSKNEVIISVGKGNVDKLSQILGRNKKNLLEFQEYLNQRKIIIERLKDKDVIALYENLNDVINQKKLPGSTIENLSVNPTIKINLLDCDYCLEIFYSQEDLEAHLKVHDFKILFFCEDCESEFSTNKAKRAHSITCVKKLICKYCNFVLESRGKKRQHEQKHCDAIYGQLCDICGEKFKHQGTLDQHIKTQHMNWEKIFQCPKCPKKFAFKQKLSFHLKSVHTSLRAYLCEDCGADFKNPASLRHHRIRKHQPSSNKRECQVCHKVVPFYSLSKHMYTHKAYTIKCPHCDKMFKNSSTLKQHLRIHEDRRPYRCEHCGAGFNRRDGLRLHMRVHLKSNSRALRECSCQICSEKFPNHSMLVIHRNRVHKDGKQYTCHICNRSMLSSRSLEWHMSHIHNQIPPGISRDQADPNLEKKRVSCNHCNKTFKTEMILRTHIKNTHMEKNPVKCLDCDLMFTSEVRLKHHMMIAHNRFEGTLICPHCPKRFVNQLRLKTHMISHSEDRPYTCELCGFNLKTKIQLIKHHQNKHSDERPLQCRYCAWRCKQVSALVCHERTHTNERPYSCIVCKQRFKYLGDKNKHQRRHESLGGSGFKRIVAGRNLKQSKNHEAENSSSDQEQLELEGEYETIIEGEQQFEEQVEHETMYEDDHETIKFETVEVNGNYEQEYDETSGEVSDSAEVIMSIEDTPVYTEEVTADNIEHMGIIADDITNHILQPGAIVQIRQQDENGKIQVIPVMLALPELNESGTEVSLTTASIIYDDENN
ncbi:uncharacterized protein LOC123258869 [Cotesia glomerata]|uniref:Uncharacterized protein n=1 Tax=Cotesia glomerata TaxID=32391 RepID=A0AAV7I4Q0_COTGL|nr:uncharacterized protein LOC123258869 [Cotesia glomerata]KAH0540186.1 hypothetical protein KQX54_014217 [Cotesia glomerata]